ncbi:MAG: chromophore lyase CpcT/CpeT, partial [Bacteroidia bacterium]
MRNFLLLLLCLGVFSSTFAQEKVKLKKNDLAQLQKRMVGSFHSEAQSKRDTNYFHICLNMVPIWKKSTDGYWLYVEQATASAMQRPYRQRVYHVFQQDEFTLVSQVYELPNPYRFAGEWKKEEPLANLTKDSLLVKDGCAIYLNKNQKGDFYGSTPGKECPSALRGAKYATSEVVIEKKRIISWDRGFNAKDEHVWG